MKNTIDKINKRIIEIVVSDKLRQKFLFVVVNILIAIVALVMTLVNVLTSETILYHSTAVFFALCIVNVVLILATEIDLKIIFFIFKIESLSLIAFFIISGVPGGFSAQWICLIPFFAFLIFGIRKAFLYVLTSLVMLFLLFWTPQGRDILMFPYTDVFLLRFPLYYTSIVLMSLVTEKIRSETQRQLEKSRKEYHYLYRHDSLTGLYNRIGIQDFILEESKNADRLSLIIMDVDDFKNINDTYGHVAGDEVLKSISAIPLEIMCDHSRFCRWGGEEFLLFMQCEHNPMEIAEKIRCKIENQVIEYNGEKISVTVSIGVAISTSDNKVSAHTLLERADKALYKSKSNGKNQVTLYELDEY